MDKNSYEPEIRELIEKIYAQKRDMSKDVFRTLSSLEKLAYEKEDYILQGFVHFHIADALYSYEQDYDEFRQNLGKAVKFFQLGGEKELLARTFNYVAVDALNNGSFDVAYLYLMNALQTCEKVDNDYLLSIINNNIGQVFARMHSHKKAIKYVRISTELQGRSTKEDYYYYQNMICGYFSEGVLCSLDGDLEGAKIADANIARLESETDISHMPSVFIPIALLRLMIAILEDEDDRVEIWTKDITGKLLEAHRLYDYITDIEDLCYFLIDHDHLETVGEILEIVKQTVDATTVVQMRKILSSIEIAYYEKLGDRKQVNAHLREQYLLSEQQQNEQNRIYQYSIDLINIMDEQRKEQEKMRLENAYLQSQVQTDPLTGIPNRLKLDLDLPAVFERTRKDRLCFGVSLMDIDKFKSYNDTYGHLAGDICLQKIAKAIQEVSDRNGVHCARYGGDEFVMIYENKTDEEIMNIAGELADRIRDLDIDHSMMGNGRVSISQGICNCVPEDKHDRDDFLSEADNALYAVKKNLDLPGRDNSVRLVSL